MIVSGKLLTFISILVQVNSRKEIKEAVDLAFKQDSQVKSYQTI